MDRIDRSIFIAAPPEKVWPALADAREFGTWFKVDLHGPFVAGEELTGAMTYPGHEGAPFIARIEAIEPPRRFAFRWPAYGGEEDGDLSHLPWMLVEFTLTAEAGGTRVRVTESGFEALPPEIGRRARDGNDEGWRIQLENIKAHVE